MKQNKSFDPTYLSDDADRGVTQNQFPMGKKAKEESMTKEELAQGDQTTLEEEIHEMETKKKKE
jgi:hypothetical protein